MLPDPFGPLSFFGAASSYETHKRFADRSTPVSLMLSRLVGFLVQDERSVSRFAGFEDLPQGTASP